MLAGENEEAFEELLRLNGSPRAPGQTGMIVRDRRMSFDADSQCKILDEPMSV